jgi:hypothetical protein
LVCRYRSARYGRRKPRFGRRWVPRRSTHSGLPAGGCCRPARSACRMWPTRVRRASQRCPLCWSLGWRAGSSGGWLTGAAVWRHRSWLTWPSTNPGRWPRWRYSGGAAWRSQARPWRSQARPWRSQARPWRSQARRSRAQRVATEGEAGRSGSPQKAKPGAAGRHRRRSRVQRVATEGEAGCSGSPQKAKPGAAGRHHTTDP